MPNNLIETMAMPKILGAVLTFLVCLIALYLVIGG